MELSQLGASGAVVIVVILFLKFIRDETTIREQSINSLSKAIDKNTKANENHLKAIDKQVEASVKAREASHEVLDFMKKLNGKLETATIQKVAEQQIKHQTVQAQDIVQSKEI